MCVRQLITISKTSETHAKVLQATTRIQLAWHKLPTAGKEEEQ